jgi:hypothetical protein
MVERRKMEGDELTWVLIHIYMEMSQETPCVATLNKQKCLFFKNAKREGKRGPVWGLTPVGGGGYEERV